MEEALIKLFNSFFTGESARITLVLCLFAAVYKGIPWAIRHYNGERKRDIEKWDATRDYVQEIRSVLLPKVNEIGVDVKTQNTRLGEINGSFKLHCANTDIHATRLSIINDPVMLIREQQWERYRQEMKDTVTQIFEYLDELRSKQK